MQQQHVDLVASLRRNCEELLLNVGELHRFAATMRDRGEALETAGLDREDFYRAKYERHRIQTLLATLTERQLEVLKRVLGGQGNKAIAFDLGVSSKTIETHRARLMQKLKARSFAELVRLALAGGCRFFVENHCRHD
jgi:DNA-binding NarL/FixJ family response regulator